VIVPGAPGYDEARRPALVRFHDVRPQAIVRCAGAGDVAESLAFARRAGVPVAARSGGHCFAGRSSTPGIVIDVSPMDAVSVADGTARVGAGARLAGLNAALDEHGVTMPLGCGPTVGIAGLTLGGGLGILGRKHGLVCDGLLAARVVLADGQIVETDDQREPDLFWALRGAGGGRFGVVTELTFRTLPEPAATMFHLVWPHATAAAVIEAWQAWAPDAPDEMNASLKLSAGDGVPTVHLFGAMLADEPATLTQLGELIAHAGAAPSATSLNHLRYREAKDSLVGVGEAEDDEPGVMTSRSELFRRPLPADAIEALVDGWVRGRGEINFTPLGGAYNRVPADATAFAHRDERYVVEHVQTSGDGGWVQRSWATTHPYGSGRIYPNFPEPGLDAWGDAYHGENLERLRQIARFYDPDGVFSAAGSAA
jgi:FAD/FMN-containing dehydrogenase